MRDFEGVGIELLEERESCPNVVGLRTRTG